MRKRVASQEGQPVRSPFGHGHLKRVVVGEVAVAVLTDVLQVGNWLKYVWDWNSAVVFTLQLLKLVSELPDNRETAAAVHPAPTGG